MTLPGILGFTSTQAWVLVDNGYDSQEYFLYWKFTDIKECFPLKANIPASRGGVSYGDRKIKCLQALDWWVTYLTMRGKIIDINNFENDILAGAIEESRIDFEDTTDGKGGLSKPKEFSHEKWTQWEDSIYNYFVSTKNSRGVPLSYVIRKDSSSPEDSENRDMQIIYVKSLFGNMFTRDSRKVLDILKELNLGTDAETCIKV